MTRDLAATIFLLSVLCNAGPTRAQVYVVDEAGGPGSQYTDLPAAVAAVPDGATLRVRPGNYTPFAIAGKGLAVVGEDPDRVTLFKLPAAVPLPPVVAGTSSSQPVLLKNLTFPHATVFGIVTLRLQAANGAVVLDGVKLGADVADLTALSLVLSRGCGPASGCTARVHGSTRCAVWRRRVARNGAATAAGRVLQISDCTIAGVTGVTQYVGAGPAGTPALHLVRSRCVAVRSTLTGGHGAFGCASFPGCNSTSGPGGTGVVVDDRSTFIGLRTPLRGADGVSRYAPPVGGWVDGSNGGDGIHVCCSAQAFLAGAVPTGGAAGIGFGGQLPGVPFVLQSGGTLQVDAAATPSAGEIRGTMAVNQTIRFALDAKPGSLGLLLLGYGANLVPLEPLTWGSLLSPFALTVGPLSVPASGSVELPYVVPPGWPLGQTFWGQFLSVEPVSNRLWATNSFALHVNH